MATTSLWIDPGHTDDEVGMPNAAKDDALHTIRKANPDLETWLREQLLMTDATSYALADRFRSDQTQTDLESTDPERQFTPLTSVLGPNSSDHRANTHVFLATRPVQQYDAGHAVTSMDPDNVVPDDVFPTALRITIDVYDPQQRLVRPTRHVIIATVGG